MFAVCFLVVGCSYCICTALFLVCIFSYLTHLWLAFLLWQRISVLNLKRIILNSGIFISVTRRSIVFKYRIHIHKPKGQKTVTCRGVKRNDWVHGSRECPDPNTYTLAELFTLFIGQLCSKSAREVSCISRQYGVPHLRSGCGNNQTTCLWVNSGNQFTAVVVEWIFI